MKPPDGCVDSAVVLRERILHLLHISNATKSKRNDGAVILSASICWMFLRPYLRKPLKRIHLAARVVHASTVLPWSVVSVKLTLKAVQLCRAAEPYLIDACLFRVLPFLEAL